MNVNADLREGLVRLRFLLGMGTIILSNCSRIYWGLRRLLPPRIMFETTMFSDAAQRFQFVHFQHGWQLASARVLAALPRLSTALSR
jgi:hypothetical protein